MACAAVSTAAPDRFSKTLDKGRYCARVAHSEVDVRRVQAFRAQCFGTAVAHDADAYDAHAMHVVIEGRGSRALVGCFRLLLLDPGDLTRSYGAQFYDLSALEGYPGLMMEMGRFCVQAGRRDPDIVRLAWAMITDQVDHHGVQMLFGCSSFLGTDPAPYLDAFALLNARHLAPSRWPLRVKAPEVFRFDQAAPQPLRLKQAMRAMPPLLRTYLMMGGWVSDHAVVDAHMDTLHVFTGLEINAIPPARQRLLRALV